MKTEEAILANVPQVKESLAENKKRLDWFRDSKFGMFIHWGPCSIGAKEIGWGRSGNRPGDINMLGERTDDPEYDNYYKAFNPVKYDPDAWAKFAKASGMKYLVLVTKHHDGFSMFNTKQSDYNIMKTPYAKDIVASFVKACHDNGIKAGLYYSTRDWFHQDYLVGDNKKYDTWYQAQVEELLTNYGKIDIMWFDHVGGHDWGKWRFADLFAMMYRCQPDLLVNNRAARFCGPTAPDDKEPSPLLERVTLGDYYTPEGSIGAMDISSDWESCIHVGQGWSYRGEDGFKGPEECIKMLVSCTTGGGNLLLNFGPRPDGTFVDGEAKVAEAIGEWLAKYGEAVYETRGGPFPNGAWGGSCHKDNKIFLHIFQWNEGEGLVFAPPSVDVLSAKTLDGKPVDFKHDGKALTVNVKSSDRVHPVTVIELTISKPLEEGVLFRDIIEKPDDLSEYGNVISENASFELSSKEPRWNKEEDHKYLLSSDEGHPGFAFCTEYKTNQWVTIDLGEERNIKAMMIRNSDGDRRSDGIQTYISNDGDSWEKIWEPDMWDQEWFFPVTHFHAGINVLGRKARFVKIEQPKLNILALSHLKIYGD